jgi:hypothetical protein
MTVTKADLDQALELEATLRADDSNELACLPNVAGVLAYIAATARSEGESEADHVEMVVRLSNMPPDEVRAVERELRALGYIAVCDRLRSIVGKRKRELAPLPE